MSAESRFRAGDAVRISDRTPFGHMRTPAYVRGRTGVVERDCGDFPDPERLAYHRSDGPPAPLYRVRLRMADLWRSTERQGDSLEIEIFGHWLERVAS